MAPIDKKNSIRPEVRTTEEATPHGLPASGDPQIGGTSLMSPSSGYKFQFDFEVGYLVKSPCRTCPKQPQLPLCADNCQILDRIHTVLSRIVSCSRRK